MVEAILKREYEKGTGRAGRSGTQSGEDKVDFAAEAFARHNCTGYDDILKYRYRGVERGEVKRRARRDVRRQVDDIMKQWGRDPERKRPVAREGRAKPGRPRKAVADRVLGKGSRIAKATIGRAEIIEVNKTLGESSQAKVGRPGESTVGNILGEVGGLLKANVGRIEMADTDKVLAENSRVSQGQAGRCSEVTADETLEEKTLVLKGKMDSLVRQLGTDKILSELNRLSKAQAGKKKSASTSKKLHRGQQTIQPWLNRPSKCKAPANPKQGVAKVVEGAQAASSETRRLRNRRARQRRKERDRAKKATAQNTNGINAKNANGTTAKNANGMTDSRSQGKASEARPTTHTPLVSSPQRCQQTAPVVRNPVTHLPNPSSPQKEASFNNQNRFLDAGWLSTPKSQSMSYTVTPSGSSCRHAIPPGGSYRHTTMSGDCNRPLYRDSRPVFGERSFGAPQHRGFNSPNGNNLPPATNGARQISPGQDSPAKVLATETPISSSVAGLDRPKASTSELSTQDPEIPPGQNPPAQVPAIQAPISNSIASLDRPRASAGEVSTQDPVESTPRREGMKSSWVESPGATLVRLGFHAITNIWRLGEHNAQESHAT